MSRQDRQKLLELLVRLDKQAPTNLARRTRKLYKHKLSKEELNVLWNHEDFVPERNIYVIVRHFSEDQLGEHVALAAPVQQTLRGERHEYRLRRSSNAQNEHVGVYVLNPAVNNSNAVGFQVRCDKNVSDVYVQPDTCPLVHTIPLADMHDRVTLFLTDKDTGFLISLCFFFE